MSDFIFYHIEKCGGSSLRFSLYEYFSKIYLKKYIYLPEHHNNINFLPNKIEKVKKNNLYDDKVILSHIRYNSFPKLTNSCKFKFTSVRNPILRIISHYYFFEYPKNNIEMIDLNKNDFDNFILNHGKHIGNCLDIPENSKISEIDRILRKFNYIAVVENFENDIKTLNLILNAIYNVNNKLNYTIKNNNNKYIKEKKKLYSIIDKYNIYDKIIYNRILELKRNKIIC